MALNNTNSKRKHWCFTLNNYTEEHIDKLNSLALAPKTSEVPTPNDYITFLVYGKEVGKNGTPHLQGFISFHCRKRRRQVANIIPNAHLSFAIDIERSIEYCKKDGDYTIVGEQPPRSGKRNDLEHFKTAVKKMQKDGLINKDTLIDEHTAVAAKYPQFFHDYILSHDPVPKPPELELTEWQQDIKQILDGEPNRREIIFVVDRLGGAGKTKFAHWYITHETHAQIIVPGKKTDMAYAYNTANRVVIFDCPRSKQGDFLQYDFLEELKNGYIFNTKYHSVIRRFKPPHVVVMMNELPDMTKLSEDRYVIKEIND